MKQSKSEKCSAAEKGSKNKPAPRRRKRLSEAEKVYKSRRAVFERVSIVLFVSAVFFSGLCLVFLKRPEFSESEKRELAKKPVFTVESYLNGSFARDFTAYFSDTVPFREKLMKISAAYNGLKGISAPKFYGNVNVVADDEGNAVDTLPFEDAPLVRDGAVTSPPTAEPVSPPATKLPDGIEVITAPPLSEKLTQTQESSPDPSSENTARTEQAAPPAAEEEVKNINDFNNNGIVVDSVKMYGDNAGVMLFGGSKKMGTRYAELISSYKRAMGEDVNVYNIVVPTSVEFYLPKKFQKYSSSEKDAIDHIYSSYTADVIPVDAYSEIAAHTDEYIYLRTDHHWSPRGAYYAYAALCRALGQTPPDIDEDYEVRQIDGFVGSLYGYTNDPVLQNSPELFTYYKPQTPYKTYYYNYDTLKPKGEGSLFYDNVSPSYAYGVFLGADAVHTKIVTVNETGRKVCVFKESYGNAFVPYLIDSFDEIYVIDIRYFGRNAVDYMKQQGITDVIFINNAFAANTSSLIDGIEWMYTYPYGTLSADKIPAVEQYLVSVGEALPGQAAPAGTEAPAVGTSPAVCETRAAETQGGTG